MNRKMNNGLSMVALVVIIALLILVGYYLFSSTKPKYEVGVDDTEMTKEVVEQAVGDTDNTSSSLYQGQVLAGSSSPYLDFNKSDYEKALASGKIVLLNFYANWCPICQAEQPEIFGAFNSLDHDKVIGFRVNYKDNNTDSFETGLAREFGVAYQHTKVILKDGVRIGKYPDSWTKDRYLSEISKLTQ